jgi:glycosyltransferase involved in cell wall biosynthesis
VGRAENLSAVYAYEDGAAATFSAARTRGLRCIYDLPIGYWRAAHALYDEEKDREPEWASTLSGTQDSPAKLARKDEELQAADLVVVASSFTRETLQMAPVNKPVKLVIYGAPASAKAPPLDRSAGKLRVLFVGGLGQRKGLSYLLKAVEMLGDGVELTFVGRKAADDCVPLNAATAKHRWRPSLPHAEVLEEMKRHDVLLFPSLFEGFGLVILEAMSQGLPVITTSHTAGPDVIRDGVDGFIVPIRSPEEMARRLDQLASDPALLAAMKVAAWERARQFTWESYRENLAAAVRGALNPAPERLSKAARSAAATL